MISVSIIHLRIRCRCTAKRNSADNLTSIGRACLKSTNTFSDKTCIHKISPTTSRQPLLFCYTESTQTGKRKSPTKPTHHPSPEPEPNPISRSNQDAHQTPSPPIPQTKRNPQMLPNRLRKPPNPPGNLPPHPRMHLHNLTSLSGTDPNTSATARNAITPAVPLFGPKFDFNCDAYAELTFVDEAVSRDSSERMRRRSRLGLKLLSGDSCIGVLWRLHWLEILGRR
jgi:hypothetical protein